MRRTLLLLSAAFVAVVMVTPAFALPQGTVVRRYRGSLNFPVDMAWAQGTNKIFFTEKNTGKIRVMVGRNLRATACRNLDVENSGERGALGIVLHPNFSQNHWLYVYYTQRSPLQHRVTRFTVVNNRCRSPRHILSGIGAQGGGYHNGGQLEFVKGKLFVSTGEQHQPAAAQNTDNRLGKVLRVNAGGSIPPGNPFSQPGDRNPVWSYGHRNPFGLTHKPGTKQLFETENGPNCDDEFNRIVKGRNYGWGSGYGCGTAGVGPNPKPPLRRWGSIIVPTDPWWYRGRMGKLNGDVYVGDFSEGRIHRLLINSRGTRVRGDRIIHNAPAGITDVSKGPGGWLYFLTSGAMYRIVPR
ncbi:MAG: PQQ-dependent sugar dehydrogenase [Actinomycetota bacterium]